MSDFLQRLKQRKLVQWALAYVAAAFALLQGIDIVAQRFAWPGFIERGLIIATCVGFFIVLLFAWYHGERGVQKMTGVELLILAGVLAVGGGLLWRYARVSPPDTTTQAGAADSAAGKPWPSADIPFKSIAVLPFANMSGDPTQGYFSDGIAEELLNRLAQLPDLKVAARTSAFQFKGRNEDVSKVGRELRVAHVLEGSVQKAGTTLRITAQLIDCRTGYQLWSHSYDRNASDVFKVQDEIAGAIANALKARLGSAQTDATPVRKVVPAAYDAYLQGRAFIAKRGRYLDDAITAFDHAISIDPTYSAAYSAKAFATLLRPLWGLEQPSSAILDNARRSAETALQLDPQNAEAYMVRGMVAFYGRDPVAASVDLDRALALAPGDIDIINMDGDLRMYSGDLGAAERDKRKAMALDPLAYVHPMNLADILTYEGRNDEAIVAAEQSIAQGAGRRGYDRLVWAYMHAHELDRARQAHRKLCALDSSMPGDCRSDQVIVLAAEGHKAQAEALLDSLLQNLRRRDYVGLNNTPSGVASLGVQLHDIPKATAAMREALDQGDWIPTQALLSAPGGAKLPEEISTDPQWLAVWNDPRIKPLTDTYRRNLLAWRAQAKPR